MSDSGFYEMAQDRGAICEAPSEPFESTFNRLGDRVRALQVRGDFFSPVAAGVRAEISELLRDCTNDEWRALAALAGRLNPPGDVNAH